MSHANCLDKFIPLHSQQRSNNSNKTQQQLSSSSSPQFNIDDGGFNQSMSYKLQFKHKPPTKKQIQDDFVYFIYTLFIFNFLKLF